MTLNGGFHPAMGGRQRTALDISAQGLIIGANGGRLDLNGNNVTLASPILGTGTMTVTNGTLTLSAANTYAGGTVVGSGATLVVNNTTGSGTGPGSVTVQNGASLTGSGSSAGSVTVSGGGNVNPGVGVGTTSVGALTIGPAGTFTKPGASFNFEFNGTANDQVVVTSSGGLVLNGGAINVLQAGSPFGYVTPGTYNLVQFSGAIGGTGLDSTWTTASPFNPHIANQQAGAEYSFRIERRLFDFDHCD